jgi:hypothetical protein
MGNFVVVVNRQAMPTIVYGPFKSRGEASAWWAQFAQRRTVRQHYSIHITEIESPPANREENE